MTNAPAAGGLSGAAGLAYDSAGNLTAGGGLGMAYDCWGHLTNITGSSSGALTFTYDSSGRRVSKTVGATTTYFLYDGYRLIAEMNASGTVTRSYTWGALGLVSDRSGTQSRIYTFDAAGNTRALFSSNGTLLERGAYSAWGSALNASYQLSTPFGWNGRSGVYRDGESGLVQMGFRYYAPSLGRFVSRDPMGLSAGSNVYEYCFSDPVNLADPAGLDSLWRYFCDVGCVFKGYGQFAWGTLRSPYDMYCYFSANGVSGRSVWKMAKGGAVAWWDGISGTDPEKFGNSFAAVLATAACAGAPYAEVGAVGGAGAESLLMVRAMSATEAALVTDAEGLIPTTSALGRAGMTRVIYAADWERTAPFFKAMPEGTYTHVAEFSVTRSAFEQALARTDGWGHVVEVRPFNGGITGGPTIYGIGNGPYRFP